MFGWRLPRLVWILPALLGLIAVAVVFLRSPGATEPDIALPETLTEYWRTPLSPQGAPPHTFSAVERSLDPTSCGVCHPSQYTLWKDSRHAAATGPGVHAEVVQMLRNNPKGLEECGKCHFPLNEQFQTFNAFGFRNRHYDETLYRSGLSCPACHVRRQVRFGPPRRGEAVDPPPHHGFVARGFFSQSEFCATCHQFKKGQRQRNGKLLQDTYEEWKASPYYEKGIQCQDCHMPDRQHLWRGIHDRATTQSGVTINLDGPDSGTGGREVTLSISNSGVGHLFPTYVVPAVMVSFHQAGEDGQTIPNTKEDHRIGRLMPVSLAREIEDTRIAPGQTASFAYKRSPDPMARALVVEVTVDPDEFYRRYYQAKLKQDLAPEVAKLYERALADTFENRYALWRREIPLTEAE